MAPDSLFYFAEKLFAVLASVKMVISRQSRETKNNEWLGGQRDKILQSEKNK